MSKWYTAQGNNSDVVVSSKIRLARNLADAPFPSRMSNEVRKMVCKKIFASIKNSPLAGEFDLTELQSMNDLKKVSMAEQGIISPEFAKQNGFGSVIVSKDESVSIMLCEEDHIRLSAVSSCQSLEEAYKKVIATLSPEQEEVITKYCDQIFNSGAETEEFFYRLGLRDGMKLRKNVKMVLKQLSE